jgi:hypothetical protein
MYKAANNMVFWIVALHSVVVEYQHFGGPFLKDGSSTSL